MMIFDALLMIATLLCSLVAGLLLAFAVVTMPGLRALDDRDFLRAFRAIDRVIQNNDPVFMLVWAGSVVALVAAALLGVTATSGTERVLLLTAAALYLLGVQLPTVAINIPLNNRLQVLAVDGLSPADSATARADFEPRWNRSNRVRTALSTIVALLLLLAR